MDPLTIAMIGAGVSAAGSLGTSIWNADTSAKNTAATNAMNYQIAKEQMAFQEKMSSTAYQRGMADMKAAGLNPILAYQRGGASSPSGSSAVMQSPDMRIDPNAIPSAVNAALSVYKGQQEVVNMKAQEANIRADTLNKAKELERRGIDNYIQSQTVPAAEAGRLKGIVDKGSAGNSAYQTLRHAGNLSEEAGRTVEPVARGLGSFVNSALGLKRFFNKPGSHLGGRVHGP